MLFVGFFKKWKNTSFNGYTGRAPVISATLKPIVCLEKAAVGNTHPEEWIFVLFWKTSLILSVTKKEWEFEDWNSSIQMQSVYFWWKLLPLIYFNHVFWKKKSYFQCNFSGRFTCVSIGQENSIWKCFGLMVKLQQIIFFSFHQKLVFQRPETQYTVSFYSLEKLPECALKPRLFFDFSSLWNDLFGWQ